MKRILILLLVLTGVASAVNYPPAQVSGYITMAHNSAWPLVNQRV